MQDQQNDFLSPKSPSGIRLFLLGFVTLFLELALIRYLAGSIWNLGYFPNLVLMAVFIGMGLGFIVHRLISDRQSPLVFNLALPVVMGLVVFVFYEHPAVPVTSVESVDAIGQLYFTAATKKTDQASYLPFAACFVTVVIAFALISQQTAKLFRLFRPLTAYTLDILGSCAGIVLFMIASFFELPPYIWFGVVTILFIVTQSGKWLMRLMPLASGIVIILFACRFDSTHLANPNYKGDLDVRWSPYQRVEFINDPALPPNKKGAVYINGVGHQRIGSLQELRGSYYEIPYLSRERIDNANPYQEVLIIGAGAGNDTAMALAHDSAHVDAVEIDRSIARLGRFYHPAHPYDDKRVNLVIGDGRAFMTNTQKRYDLIVFAFADSLIRVSSMSQLRLENYLFTVESIRRAYELLNDSGCIYLFNSFPQPWTGKKISAMIRRATGFEPLVLFDKKDQFAILRIGKAPHCRSTSTAPMESVDIPTDDWPFLHLKKKAIPSYYLKTLLGMAALVSLIILCMRKISPAKDEDSAWLYKAAFFLMGAAFLLLETKSIIQFSLLFGTTWLNNSLVFLGVLILVLAANWSAQVFGERIRLGVVFIFLVSSCLIPLAYPLGNLLAVHNVAMRFVIAALMTFSPIFFANLIFSMTFRKRKAPEHLFGWNLIGATVGGLLEYGSLIVGYNLLAIVVALFYALVYALIFYAGKEKVRAAAL